MLGTFDTLWYHERRVALPLQPNAQIELRLHAARDFIYSILFGSLSWLNCYGLWVWILGGLLLAEVVITLWDFIEEDRTRVLLAGERVIHAVMGINYGAFLAFYLPELVRRAQHSTALTQRDTGLFVWVFSLMSVGVLVSGVRDLVTSFSSSAHASSQRRAQTSCQSRWGGSL